LLNLSRRLAREFSTGGGLTYVHDDGCRHAKSYVNQSASRKTALAPNGDLESAARGSGLKGTTQANWRSGSGAQPELESSHLLHGPSHGSRPLYRCRPHAGPDQGDAANPTMRMRKAITARPLVLVMPAARDNALSSLDV
jgi:hypothetical protein